MQETTNYSLKLIEDTDDYTDIFDDHNDSMEIIDTELAKKLESVPVMTGATSSTAGSAGLVPAPSSGDQAKVLKGDGTWETIPTMTGAALSAAGTAGLVPAPTAGADSRFLSADGTWKEPEGGGTVTGASLGSVSITPDSSGILNFPVDANPTASSSSLLTSGRIYTEIESINDRIDELDPETPSAVFSDVNFSLAVADWTLDSQTGLYNATVQNSTLLTATAGIQVFYDASFRTALVGDIYVNKSTGYVTFSTTEQPVATLTGFLRIMDSTTGIVPVHRGGTGAATPRQARENLNTPIRDIFVDFGTVTSLPQTVYDADLRANMVAFDAVFSNPSAVPGGIQATFADPSGNLGGSVTITGTISGSTTISFYAHEKRTSAEGSETASETQRVQDFVQTNAQTLTATQKAQVLSNIGGASEEDAELLSDSCGNIITESGTYTLEGVFTGFNTGSGNYIDFFVPVYFAKSLTVTSARFVTSASIFFGTTRMNLSVPVSLTVSKVMRNGLLLEMNYSSTQTQNVQATISAIVQVVVA
jgi:hypothetical protein